MAVAKAIGSWKEENKWQRVINHQYKQILKDREPPPREAYKE